MVGKPCAEPSIGRSAPHGNQSLPRAKNLSGFGSEGAMTIYEAEAEGKAGETVIQKIFDELPVP